MISTIVAHGCDFSRGGFPGVPAMRNAGCSFVGRYAVSDLSPTGRGITRDEHAGYVNDGFDDFLYWEGIESWMLGGTNAGKAAAEDARVNIVNAGMPWPMPVYFSHDIEPNPADYPAIGACLDGAAVIIGAPYVGLYGGYDLIEAFASHPAVSWLAQTWAWSGDDPDPWKRRISLHAHLYQYDTREVPENSINGVWIDRVAALQPHYGQARDFLPHPTTTTTPNPFPPHRIPAPDHVSAQGYPLTKTHPGFRFRCIHGGTFKTGPSRTAADASIYHADKTYTFPYQTAVNGETWLVSSAGSWAPVKNFEATQ